MMLQLLVFSSYVVLLQAQLSWRQLGKHQQRLQQSEQAALQRQEQAPRPPPSCSFVLIANDFKPSSPALQEEYDIVASSWITAINQAMEANHTVSIIPVKLATDSWSLPPSLLQRSSSHLAETDAFFTDSQGRFLPTIGGVLSAADAVLDRIQTPNSTHVVFANRDIGLYPRFFSMACTILNRPGVASFEVTRLGLSHSSVVEHGIDTIMASNAVQPHPGHDMFVFPRHHLKTNLLEDRQLLFGYPPWGFILNTLLRSKAVQDGQQYLFLSGTRRRRMTFHINRQETDEIWKSFLAKDRELMAMLLEGSLATTRYQISPEALFGKRILNAMRQFCIRRPDVRPFCSLCAHLFPGHYVEEKSLRCAGVWPRCPDATRCDMSMRQWLHDCPVSAQHPQR